MSELKWDNFIDVQSLLMSLLALRQQTRGLARGNSRF
jgi:hypothetical protein